MAGIRDILSLPLVYRTWQVPIVQSKIKPILETTDLTKIKRVLDVNCGPGTNAGVSLWQMVYFKDKLKRTA
jgi:hypothetical protein